MVDIPKFLEGAQNITTNSELYTYTARELFTDSVFLIFGVFLLIMMILGGILIQRDRATFYAVFILSTLILGILLFFTFGLPIIPEMLEKFLGGIF